MNLCDMSPQQIMILATAISGLLADDCSPDEMFILGEIFRIVADSLFTMGRISVLQNKVCTPCGKGKHGPNDIDVVIDEDDIDVIVE